MAFRRHVVPESYDEDGVVFVVERDFDHQARELQESYRGVPRQEVARPCFLWRSDPEGFGARHPPDIGEAIRDFITDRSQREEEEKAWRAAEAERCEPPTPPIGYSWRPAFGLIEKYVLVWV